MSTNQHCLNCNERVSKKFCPNCGQKTNTHKITFKHFLLHDIVHGVWHFERGILFTLKEAIIRPGQAGLDYIRGKRVRYYNVFYLSLLLIGLHLLLLHFYENFRSPDLKSMEETKMLNISNFFSKNIKFILFSIVPILGCNAFLFFKRLQLNLAEHFILAGIGLLAMIELSIVFSFVNFLNEKFSFFLIGIVEVIIFFLIALYPIWLYFNATRKQYTYLAISWRLLLFYLFVFIQISLILSAIILNLTDGEGNFYIDL
jgi:Protein of unknown function (DUF3667)